MKTTLFFLLCLLPGLLQARPAGPVRRHDPKTPHNRVFDITDAAYGATTDNPNNAMQIQSAIRAAHEAGGGTVRVPDGTFTTGTITMVSSVTLELSAGAVLQGVTDRAAYPNPPKPPDSPYNGNYALIYAADAHDIAIIGADTQLRRGVIDGQGGAEAFKGPINSGGRPKIVCFINCTNVSVSHLTLQNSAFYVLQFLGCKNATAHALNITSLTNWNNDGIDMDADGATITDCTIVTTDDAICLKSDFRDRPCKNVTVSNCTVASNTNAIKFGTSGYGGFQNIRVSNCTVNKVPANKFCSGHGFEGVFYNYYVFSAIAIENVDGGITDGIYVSHIDILAGVLAPIFIKFGNRNVYAGTRNRTWKGKPVDKHGLMTNIHIDDVTGSAVTRLPSSITGFLPNRYVTDVSLSNVVLTAPGGASQTAVTRTVPDSDETQVGDEFINGKYPESPMFGRTLPGHGLYVRHATNVRLTNCRFWAVMPDSRPAVWAENASLTIDGLRGPAPVGEGVFVWLHNCHRPTAVYNSVCQQPATALVAVTGNGTTGITVYANKSIPAGQTQLISRSEEVFANQVIVSKAEHP